MLGAQLPLVTALPFVVLLLVIALTGGLTAPSATWVEWGIPLLVIAVAVLRGGQVERRTMVPVERSAVR